MHIYLPREEKRGDREGMDECARSCKRSAVMEVVGGGVKTRDMDEVSSKRRRSDGTGSHLVNVSARNLNLMNSSSPANSTTSSVDTVAHEQSGDVVTNGLRSTDLKIEDSETESSTFTIAEFRETSTVSSDLCRGDSGDMMESSLTTRSEPSPKDSHVKVSAKKMPSKAEMDEFFSAFEKAQQKQFIEKYNYDIVKDVPLEGRYEWVRLKP